MRKEEGSSLFAVLSSDRPKLDRLIDENAGIYSKNFQGVDWSPYECCNCIHGFREKFIQRAARFFEALAGIVFDRPKRFIICTAILFFLLALGFLKKKRISDGEKQYTLPESRAKQDAQDYELLFGENVYRSEILIAVSNEKKSNIMTSDILNALWNLHLQIMDISVTEEEAKKLSTFDSIIHKMDVIESTRKNKPVTRHEQFKSIQNDKNIKLWLENDGYHRQNITDNDLSLQLSTGRAPFRTLNQLLQYINESQLLDLRSMFDCKVNRGAETQSKRYHRFLQAQNIQGRLPNQYMHQLSGAQGDINDAATRQFLSLSPRQQRQKLLTMRQQQREMLRQQHLLTQYQRYNVGRLENQQASYLNADQIQPVPGEITGDLDNIPTPNTVGGTTLYTECDLNTRPPQERILGLACKSPPSKNAHTFATLCIKDIDGYCEVPDGVVFMYTDKRDYGTPLSYPMHFSFVLKKSFLTETLVSPKGLRLSHAGDKVTETSALMIRYLLTDSKEIRHFAKAWELKLEKFIAQNRHAVNGTTLYLKTERSFADDLVVSGSAGGAVGEALMVVLAGAILAIYVFISTFSMSHFTSKAFPSLMGLVAGFFGYMAGAGTCYFAGVPHTTPATAAPFLVLGISLDDIYVLLNAYALTFNQRFARKRIQHTLKEGGLSITLTTVTNLLSFSVGATSPYVGIRSFCIITATSLFFAYISIVTVFLAFLSIDAYNEEIKEPLFLLRTCPLPIINQGTKCSRRRQSIYTDDGDANIIDENANLAGCTAAEVPEWMCMICLRKNLSVCLCSKRNAQMISARRRSLASRRRMQRRSSHQRTSRFNYRYNLLPYLDKTTRKSLPEELGSCTMFKCVAMQVEMALSRNHPANVEKTVRSYASYTGRRNRHKMVSGKFSNAFCKLNLSRKKNVCGNMSQNNNYGCNSEIHLNKRGAKKLNSPAIAERRAIARGSQFNNKCNLEDPIRECKYDVNADFKFSTLKKRQKEETINHDTKFEEQDQIKNKKRKRKSKVLNYNDRFDKGYISGLECEYKGISHSKKKEFNHENLIVYSSATKRHSATLKGTMILRNRVPYRKEQKTHRADITHRQQSKNSFRGKTDLLKQIYYTKYGTSPSKCRWHYGIKQNLTAKNWRRRIGKKRCVENHQKNTDIVANELCPREMTIKRRNRRRNQPVPCSLGANKVIKVKENIISENVSLSQIFSGYQTTTSRFSKLTEAASYEQENNNNAVHFVRSVYIKSSLNIQNFRQSNDSRYPDRFRTKETSPPICTMLSLKSTESSRATHLEDMNTKGKKFAESIAARRDALRQLLQQVSPAAMVEPRGNVGRNWRLFMFKCVGRMILNPFVKLFILIFFLSIFIISIIGFSKLERGLDPRKLSPDGSQLQDFFKVQRNYFSLYGDAVHIFFSHPDNVCSATFRAEYISLHQTLRKASYTRNIEDGLLMFFQSPQGQYLPEQTPLACRQMLHSWLQTPIGSSFASDFLWRDSYELRGWTMLLLPKGFESTKENSNFMVELRQDPLEITTMYLVGVSRQRKDICVEWLMLTNFLCYMAPLTAKISCFLKATKVSVFLLPSFSSAALVIINLILIDVSILGFMYYIGLPLNMLTMVNLIISIGFSVDYSSHLTHTFCNCAGRTRDTRAFESLVLVGGAVFHGALSSILGICPLAFSKSYVLRTFFQMMCLVLFSGLAHGVVLLPVLLSLVGPLQGGEMSVFRSCKQFFQLLKPRKPIKWGIGGEKKRWAADKIHGIRREKLKNNEHYQRKIHQHALKQQAQQSRLIKQKQNKRRLDKHSKLNWRRLKQ